MDPIPLVRQEAFFGRAFDCWVGLSASLARTLASETARFHIRHCVGIGFKTARKLRDSRNQKTPKSPVDPDKKRVQP